ncbi:MAG: 2'-5' RNA ligase family protein [Frankiaceae bacterium]|nr:2'-5' RNA ligase family protein [Frankiaceae bacterium]
METAILLCVPEAEPLVHEWRLQGDPSAAHGVPAHVTLLYPFLPVASVDDGVLAELGWFFAGVDAFGVRFTRVQRFENAGVVWIEPASDALVELTRAVARRWPECPPYSGEIPVDELVPHLTIVQTDDRALRQSAADAVSPGLPFDIVAASASLWVQDEHGTWSERATFPFGPPE